MTQSNSKPKTDVANMVGEWRNVNANIDYISRLNISTAGDGQLSLRLFDARSMQGRLLGEVEVSAFTAPQSLQAIGFCSHFEVAGMKTTIAANGKLGVLVLQSYTEFTDVSSRQNILTREFYRRDQSLELTNPDRESNLTGEDLVTESTGIFHVKPRQEDFECLRGRWVNTYAETSWVTALTVANIGTEWSTKLSFQGQNDPSEELLMVPFVFDSNEVGFTTHSATDDAVSTYAAYSNKGLIVMSGFHDFRGNDQPQRVMSREFYYKHV